MHQNVQMQCNIFLSWGERTRKPSLLPPRQHHHLRAFPSHTVPLALGSWRRCTMPSTSCSVCEKIYTIMLVLRNSLFLKDISCTKPSSRMLSDSLTLYFQSLLTEWLVGYHNLISFRSFNCWKHCLALWLIFEFIFFVDQNVHKMCNKRDVLFVFID